MRISTRGLHHGSVCAPGRCSSAFGLAFILIGACAPRAYAFPLVVHQLWTPGGEPGDSTLRSAMHAWRDGGLAYRLWNDSTAVPVLLRHGGKAALDAYKAFTPAQKKDYFMYVVLAEEGGLFVDCDVRPLQPPGRWLREFGALGDEVLLGLEAHGDEDQQQALLWASKTQLSNWAAASRPNSTVMRWAADAVLRAHRRQAITSEYMSTLIYTGPGLLTRVVQSILARRSFDLEDFESVRGGRPSDAREGIRVLGINGFGCGQRHSGSARCETTPGVALVRHEFAGTWKWQLCANKSASDFLRFAEMQAWCNETWVDDLRRRSVRLACGPRSADSGLEDLRPLFALPYPPLLPRPPSWCELSRFFCPLPPLLPRPRLGQRTDLRLLPCNVVEDVIRM